MSRLWADNIVLTTLLFVLAGQSPLLAAPIQLQDVSGHRVNLNQPAQRIISLAPNITELLFSVGAGDSIIGTIEHSDYPPAARTIRRIGDHQSLDIEAIIALKPDLIIAWPSGNPARQIQTLRQLGLVVFNIDPQHLTDIPTTLEQLGQLTGNSSTATTVAATMRDAITALQQRYRQQRPVSVFIQLWPQPLYTINNEHLISDIIKLCGGNNVFATLPTLSPRIDVEAVLQADPEVIITTTEDGVDPDSLQQWHRWPQLRASRNGHLYGIEPDAISINSTRIMHGAERLCQLLQQARGTNAAD